MEHMVEDTRQRAHGSPLRRSEEVMYLPMQEYTSLAPSSRDPDELPEFIYESQVPVMVTGIDDWVWAAYCFVDVYFKVKEGEHHTEQVEYYSNPGVLPRDQKDPHSCGKHQANRPIWNPREYFLRAFSARMEQVREEWDNSVMLLIYQIEPYVRMFDPFNPSKLTLV